MKKTTTLYAIALWATFAQAQNVGIGTNTPNASAKLEITDANRGILIPRLALSATNVAAPVTTPATSLLVYNTATAGVSPTDVSPGFYYWDGTQWVKFDASNTRDWKLDGNNNGVLRTIGTNDAFDFVTETNGTEKMRVTTAGNVGIGDASPLALLTVGNGDLFQVLSTGHARGINATAATPAYSFTANTGTGLFQNTANELSVATNGTHRASIMPTGELRMTGNGTATSPIFSWTTDTDLGIYRSATDQMDIATVGVSRARFYATGDVDINPTGAELTGILNVLTVFTNSAGNDVGFAVSGSTNHGAYLQNASTYAQLGAAAWGFNNTTTGIGVAGSNLGATSTYLHSGSGGSFTGALRGVMGFGTTTTAGQDRFGGYFCTQTASTTPGLPSLYVYVGGRDFNNVDRKIVGTGTVNTIVKDTDEKRVLMSAPEAPENLFMDFGTAQLVNGRAKIQLDPTYAKNIVVNAQHPLRVFVQLEGDCNGVFITNKTNQGFEVVELNGGTSNVSFSYHVVGNRADEYDPDGTRVPYSDERFSPAPIPQQSGVAKHPEMKK